MFHLPFDRRSVVHTALFQNQYLKWIIPRNAGGPDPRTGFKCYSIASGPDFKAPPNPDRFNWCFLTYPPVTSEQSPSFLKVRDANLLPSSFV